MTRIIPIQDQATETPSRYHRRRQILAKTDDGKNRVKTKITITKLILRQTTSQKYSYNIIHIL